jgi:hypothetical protein
MPLGYEVEHRKLVVNESEAATVRMIFTRYLELGSAIVLQAELEAHGVVSKLRVGKNGEARGGQAFTRGALYNLLQNVTYIGEVAHKGDRYPGRHQPLLEREVFDAAQARLAANRADRRHGTNAANPSLLAGLLFDARGVRLSPSHATKGPRRFRYYVATESEPATGRKTRVPASSIEAVIITRVTTFLRDGHAIDRLTGSSGTDAVTLEGLLHGASAAAADLEGGTSARKRELLLALIRHIALAENEVAISLDASALFAMTSLPMPADGLAEITLSGSYELVRRSREVRLAVAPGSEEPAPDPTLVKLIVKAHAARQALFAADGASLAEVARMHGHEPGYFAVLVKLAYLAPDIIDAILAGRQPRRLDRQTLARIRQLPIEWDAQRRMLGSPANVRQLRASMVARRALCPLITVIEIGHRTCKIHPRG